MEGQRRTTAVIGAMTSFSPRSSQLVRWFAVAGLTIPFVVLLIQQFTELSDRRLPCCDYSALELGTRAFLYRKYNL